jgi:glycolate oxidase FAD binding subunit
MPPSLSFFSLLPSCDPAILQSCAVRDADVSDDVDGVRPRYVVEPGSADALAGLLECASRDRVSVVLRGGGTKLGWGRGPNPIDLVIVTRRLNGVLAHAHGDLTATVEAGTTVGALNQELARRGQWLPVDNAFEEATVGGLIATNDSGPLRHRHGTPRDLLIGIHLAMTDGRIVKAGGTVVKNVAGYDLGKLISGSHGCLAAIVSATFKLAPLPAASTTVVATFRDADELAQAVSAVSASQIEPAAFDVHVLAGPPGARFTGSVESPGTNGVGRNPPYRALVQFASTQAAIDAQVDELRRLVVADSFTLTTGPEEAAVWRGQTRAPWSAAGSIVRASWLPSSLRALLSLLEEMAGEGGRSIQLVARAGVGAGLIRIEADPAATVAAIESLRARPDVVGHVVALRADLLVKRHIDVWGAPGDHGALLGAIRRAFDPAGVLNAGRGPV